MTTSSSQQSAIVYDFAARARAIRQARGQSVRFAEPAVPQMPTVDYGSGWYHAEAIREDERTRKP